MTPDTVAVDLDGTLITCAERQLAAFRVACDERRVRFNGLEDQFWHWKRSGLTTIEAAMRLGIDADDAAKVAARWIELVEADEMLVLDRVLDGAGHALVALRDGGCRIVLLSARQRPTAAFRQIDRLGLRSLLDEVEIVEPSSAAELKAGRLRHHQCHAIIGDSEVDAAAADAAGVTFFPVVTGQRSRAWWLLHGYPQPAPDLAAAVADVLARRGRQDREG